MLRALARCRARSHESRQGSAGEEDREPPAKRQKTASPAPRDEKGKAREVSAPAEAHSDAEVAEDERNDGAVSGPGTALREMDGFAVLTSRAQKSESEMSVLDDDPEPARKRKKGESGVRVGPCVCCIVP